MDDDPKTERRHAAARNGGPAGLPVGRAAAVLVVFVATTVLVLGVIHPTQTGSGGPAGTTSTSTTAPAKVGHHPPPTTTTSTVPHSSVAVLVANASGVTGAAAAISGTLKNAGWTVQPAVNATTDLPASRIFYVAGHEDAAGEIAASLHLKSSAIAPYTTAAPISSIGTADVVVMVGPDLSTPSTTAAASPTTTVGT